MAKHPRPLSHLGLRNYVAADSGRYGDALLRTLYQALSRCPQPGPGKPRRGLGFVEWFGLLPSSEILARMCKDNRRDPRGRFPQDEKVLAELPGIGRSTAAAIAAFAFQRRAAILDGNVKRVLARVFALELDPQSSKSLRVFWDLAESLLPQDVDMPAYTQGLMDLGATCCLQRKPICTQCPLQGICQAKQAGKQEAYPLAKAKRHCH